MELTDKVTVTLTEVGARELNALDLRLVTAGVKSPEGVYQEGDRVTNEFRYFIGFTLYPEKLVLGEIPFTNITPLENGEVEKKSILGRLEEIVEEDLHGEFADPNIGEAKKKLKEAIFWLKEGGFKQMTESMEIFVQNLEELNSQIEDIFEKRARAKDSHPVPFKMQMSRETCSFVCDRPYTEGLRYFFVAGTRKELNKLQTS